MPSTSSTFYCVVLRSNMSPSLSDQLTQSIVVLVSPPTSIPVIIEDAWFSLESGSCYEPWKLHWLLNRNCNSNKCTILNVIVEFATVLRLDPDYDFTSSLYSLINRCTALQRLRIFWQLKAWKWRKPKQAFCYSNHAYNRALGWKNLFSYSSNCRPC